MKIIKMPRNNGDSHTFELKTCRCGRIMIPFRATLDLGRVEFRCPALRWWNFWMHDAPIEMMSIEQREKENG